MMFNKTTHDKYELYKRLLDRWRWLPNNIVRDIAENHNVSEEALNRVRMVKLNEFIKNESRKRN